MMRTVNFQKYDNSWYFAGNSLLILIWYFINIIFFRSYFNPIASIKVSLLRIFGAKIGTGVTIKPGVNIKYPWKLSIGNNTWIGEGVWIDNLAHIKIASNVCISQAAMLLTGNHNYKKSTFDLMVGEITLEDGVWVGAKSVVCPGVTCKSHSILTVGSIATKNLEAYSIYQGNPAIKIKDRIITQ